MNNAVLEAAWNGSPVALDYAKDAANAQVLSGVCARLSAVYSHGSQARWHDRPFAVLGLMQEGEQCAQRLRKRWQHLDFQKLHTLVRWYTQTAQRFPGRRRIAIELAHVARNRADEAYAHGDAKPYEVAIAYAALVEAILLEKKRILSDPEEKHAVERLIDCALDLKSEFEKDGSDLALLEYLRFLRMIGQAKRELTWHTLWMLRYTANTDAATKYFNDAVHLLEEGHHHAEHGDTTSSVQAGWFQQALKKPHNHAPRTRRKLQLSLPKLPFDPKKLIPRAKAKPPADLREFLDEPVDA